jgi:hypothetical protein
VVGRLTSAEAAPHLSWGDPSGDVVVASYWGPLVDPHLPRRRGSPPGKDAVTLSVLERERQVCTL